MQVVIANAIASIPVKSNDKNFIEEQKDAEAGTETTATSLVLLLSTTARSNSCTAGR